MSEIKCDSGAKNSQGLQKGNSHECPRTTGCNYIHSVMFYTCAQADASFKRLWATPHSRSYYINSTQVWEPSITKLRSGTPGRKVKYFSKY